MRGGGRDRGFLMEWWNSSIARGLERKPRRVPMRLRRERVGIGGDLFPGVKLA